MELVSKIKTSRNSEESPSYSVAQLIEMTRDLNCWRKARIRTSKSNQETDTMNSNVGLKKEENEGQSVKY